MTPKVGLVLGGGGSRALSHIGVLRVLQREQIPIDFIVGTSMGAIVGAFFALDDDINEAEQNMARTIGADLDLPAIVRTLGMLTSMARQRKIREPLLVALGAHTFDDLLYPLTVMAVDMVTGQEVQINEGPLVPALLASSAVPGVYPPIQMGAMQLADGGVIDALATHVAVEQGATHIIAVDVYPELDVSAPWTDPLSDVMGLPIFATLFNNDALSFNNLFSFDDERTVLDASGDEHPKLKQPNMASSVWRSVRVITWHTHQQRLQANPPDIYMRPNVDGYGSLDFKDVYGPISAGEVEAERHIDALRQLKAMVSSNGQ